jgi:iron(III) transport system substrate-binding protein
MEMSRRSFEMRISNFIFAAAIGLAGTIVWSGVQAVAQTNDSALDSIKQDAVAEGRITFYSTENPAVNDRLAEEFESEYGITVDVLRLATGDLLNRYASEAQAGAVAADVLLIANPRIYSMNEEWWTPLDDSVLPELAGYPETSKGGNYVRLYGHPLGITYNTSTISEENAPTEFAHVIRPEFRGKIVLTDPRSSSSWLGLADFWLRTEGEEFLSGLAAQNPSLSDSAATGAQQVAAGAFDISVGSTPAHPAPLIEKGAPLKYVTPSATVIASQTIGLSKDAPHPNAARLFANFMLSKKAAEISCRGITVSYRPDAEGCREMPSQIEQVNLDISDADKQKIYSLLGLAQ